MHAVRRGLAAAIKVRTHVVGCSSHRPSFLASSRGKESQQLPTASVSSEKSFVKVSRVRIGGAGICHSWLLFQHRPCTSAAWFMSNTSPPIPTHMQRSVEVF